MPKRIEIDLPKTLTIDRNKIKTLAEKIFSDFSIDEFALRIQEVDETAIADLNRRFRGVPTATDVLSFMLEEVPLEGEIYLCISQAGISAKNEGLPFDMAILRLIAHGVLHLCGIHHNDEFELEANEKLMQKYLNFFSE
jgi:probable rRNA maturation factor